MSTPESQPKQDGLTAEEWPIAAAMMWAGSAHPEQGAAAPTELWSAQLQEVADAGFSFADITDTWLKPGDLSTEHLRELRSIADSQGVTLGSISAIRRSVIEKDRWEDNLAYSHRTLDAAAELGIGVVSFGLHQDLTPEQQQALWFWTVQGHRDDPDDKEAFSLAADRFRELGAHAEELGIIVSLEMYEDTYLGSGESAVRLVEEIGRDNVGLNPDIGNLVRLHRPIESWQRLCELTLPYANFWHVKNYFRDEDPAKEQYFATPAPMQDGMINYRTAFKLAVEAGFQGLIMCEHYGGDMLSSCANNQDYLRRHALPKRPYTPAASRVTQQISLNRK